MDMSDAHVFARNTERKRDKRRRDIAEDEGREVDAIVRF